MFGNVAPSCVRNGMYCNRGHNKRQKRLGTAQPDSTITPKTAGYRAAELILRLRAMT